MGHGARRHGLLEDLRSRLDEHEVALRWDIDKPRLAESLLHALALPDHETGARLYLLAGAHRGGGGDLGSEIYGEGEPDPLHVVGNPLSRYPVADPEASEPVSLRERAHADHVLPFEGELVRAVVGRVRDELLVGLVQDQEDVLG